MVFSMEMKGEKIISASRQEVWDALNNPDQLFKAIPGAQAVTKTDEENLTAVSYTHLTLPTILRV